MRVNRVFTCEVNHIVFSDETNIVVCALVSVFEFFFYVLPLTQFVHLDCCEIIPDLLHIVAFISRSISSSIRISVSIEPVDCSVLIVLSVLKSWLSAVHL